MHLRIRLTLLVVLIAFPPHASAQDAEALRAAARQYDEWLASTNEDWHELLDSETFAQRYADLGEIQAAVAAIDASALAGDDLVLFDVLEHLVAEKAGAFEFGEHLIPFGFDWGPDTSLMQLGGAHPGWTRELVAEHFDQVRRYTDALRSSRTFMADGLERGLTLPRSLAAALPPRVGRLLGPELRERLIAPLGALDSSDRDALRAVFESDVWPALECEIEIFRDFLETEYVPGCRTSFGAFDLPRGKAYYAHRLRIMAETTDDPAEIHEYGLRDVSRWQRAIVMMEPERTVPAGARGEQAIRTALDLMRGDQFHYDSVRDVVRSACEWAKGIDAWLPGWFHTLPRAPFAIVERDDETPGPRAGYTIGDPDRGRAATVYFRADDLGELPSWSIGPLMLHEGAPGHHLQWGLAHEMEFAYEFRRTAWFAGFGEGWAMYAEHLGAEMGFENDPVTQFGLFASHLHRAARVVVDTGIHALGWSREVAIEWMFEQTALTRDAVERDVDRLIMWPGQACAYTLNGNRLYELREQAEAKLGHLFDVREFHDAVIGAGTVPMVVVERRVAAWIADRTES